MAQAKEMMNLLESLILQDDIKNLKTKLMETEINVRRLRIGSRHRSKDNKVMEEYYKSNEKRSKPRVTHMRNLTNLVASSRKSC